MVKEAKKQKVKIRCLSKYCREDKESYRHTLVFRYTDASDEEIKEAKENPLHKAPDHVYIYRSFIPFHSHDFHDQRSISGKILCVKKDGNSSGSKGSAESDQHGFYDRGRCGKRAGRIVF